MLPVGAATRRRFTQELNTVAFNCDIGVNLALSSLESTGSVLKVSGPVSVEGLLTPLRFRGMSAEKSPVLAGPAKGEMLVVDTGDPSTFSLWTSFCLPGGDGKVVACTGVVISLLAASRRSCSALEIVSPSDLTYCRPASARCSGERVGRSLDFLNGLRLGGSPSSEYQARFLACRRQISGII